MTLRRDYRFECCWFLILVLIVLFTPSRSWAQSMSWADLAFDCDSVMGWCLGIDVAPMFRQLF
jgi:hypothetical protein